MFQFPFGTMHQLNLDWFLQKFNELVEEWQTAEAGIDNALQAEIDRVDAAMSDLYQARDDAIGAKNDAEAAATAASGSAADALEAEGFAIGEQNGTPVSSGSPYYQANAKYYKVEAGTFSYLSEAYARGTMGGTPVDPGDAGYQDNAKYYKDAADLDASTASGAATSAGADALIAEGNAVGEQNGTPVSSGSPYYENNAKYYAQQTAQDKSDTDTLKDAANNAALRSEGYAVGEQNGTPVASGSPYYQNNAKFYATQALGAVASYILTDIVSGEYAGLSDGAANAPIQNMIITVIPKQAGSGVPSGDNIRTISGFTESKLQNGTNLFGGSYNTRWYFKKPIPANTQFTISSAVGGSGTRATTYDVDGNQINRRYIDYVSGTRRLARVTFNKDVYSINFDVANPGSYAVKIGTDESYSAYNTIETIAFPAAAGTVFGAEINLITGEFKVTDLEIASYAGESLPGSWISDRDVYDPDNPNTPTTGAQVVYKLATPVTYSITPITTLVTNYGDNNFWNDTGNTTVEYIADIKLYINKVLAEIQALALENNG